MSSDSFYFSLFLKLRKIHFAAMQTQQTGKMRPVCQKTQPLIQPDYRKVRARVKLRVFVYICPKFVIKLLGAA